MTGKIKLIHNMAHSTSFNNKFNFIFHENFLTLFSSILFMKPKKIIIF